MRADGILVLCLLLSLAAGCSPPKIILPPVVRAEGCWKHVNALVAFGQRYSGTPANRLQAQYIAKQAMNLGAIVAEQQFSTNTPIGKIAFRNIEATIPGASRDFIIIGAHFDSKMLPDNIFFEGANDGASGVALLLEMIRAINASNITPKHTLKFLFFDGEECFYNYNQHDGLFGSRYYTQQMTPDEIKKCRAVVILDMVADKDLNIAVPVDSSDKLVALMLKMASQQGTEEKFTRGTSIIIDDHVPFQKLGIPVINFIDFEFGPDNTYWHTSEDNRQNISAESMKIVGDLVLAMLFSGEI